MRSAACSSSNSSSSNSSSSNSSSSSSSSSNSSSNSRSSRGTAAAEDLNVGGDASLEGPPRRRGPQRMPKRCKRGLGFRV